MSSDPSRKADQRPNIILVTIDSLRADHCGFHGYDGETTPTLDKLANSGTVFETAIAPGPSTPESMPAIFTGYDPVERATENDNSTLQSRRERIRTHMLAHDTLAEKLSRRGYETAAFTPNPFTSRQFGFDQGFDHFQDFMDESNRSELYQRVFRGFLDGSTPASMARVLLNFWQREEVFKPWASYYDEIRQWVEQASEPYFLWVFLMDAHNPYMSDSETRSQAFHEEFRANIEFWRQSHETPFSEPTHDRLVTAYDDAIRYADQFLKRVATDFAADEPIIAVTGDHGEAFGEHGTYGHEPYLYAENMHVPLVLDGLNAATISEPVSLRRLPTLLARLADGDELVVSNDTGLSEPVATATTRDGDRIMTTDGTVQYLRRTTEPGGEIQPFDGQSLQSATTDEITPTLKHSTEIVRHSTDERRQIAQVATQLGGDI